MYVGKRTKSILSVLLICGLLVVSVPCRAYAFGPVVLGPALKYAIGAGIVAGGLYASNSESLNHVISDYWSKASDHIKQQWQSAIIYGTGIGIIVLNGNLNAHIKDYLEDNYESGYTQVYEHVEGVELGFNISYSKLVAANGDTYTLSLDDYGTYGIYRVLLNGSVIKDERDTRMYANNFKYLGVLPYFIIREDNHPAWVMKLEAISDGPSWSVGDIVETKISVDWTKPLSYWTGATGTMIVDYELWGDTAGFGNATEGRPDVKIPCPPVPAENWPDNWIDELEKELNRTDNPGLDDETSIEEWEEEWEWYLDENGNIYKVKKGQPPRKPDDEPLRIPGPPLPDPPLPEPGVPEDYPTEDDPEVTIEHNPPQTTVTENPDGSRTEITTQTSTITKRWWDPTAKRWRTTKEETTTTTTVDYAPDGTEIGRNTTTTTQPKGEREETPPRDDTAIDWEPLRRGLYELTEKFPFCLPWDLMRGIETLEANQWDRKIEIDVGDGIWPEMVIDLTMFDEIAGITRIVLLVIFDLGLIFATRRLMGGDV